MKPPHILTSFYRIMDYIRRALIIGIFSFILITGTVEIFLRYTPGLHGLSWGDEIMRYLDIWLVFLGASLAAKANGHMVMEFFVKSVFPARMLPGVRRVSLGIICLTLLILAVISFQKVLSTWNVMIQAFDIPIALFYLALPLGCLLMFLEYLLMMIYGDHPYSDRKEVSI
ncbi:MAG: TRAP transporter small permease [Deltaproteobacteria bacterium]|nr:TRAP transporter small permease [Deltaproteobacteria bacterium]